MNAAESCSPAPDSSWQAMRGARRPSSSCSRISSWCSRGSRRCRTVVAAEGPMSGCSMSEFAWEKCSHASARSYLPRPRWAGADRRPSMKAFYIVVLSAATSLAATPAAGAAFTLPLPQVQADPADSLYRRARRALDDKSYDAAARLFDSIVTRYPRSVYTPDALYWKGFALYRNGNLDAAVAALETQADRYPNAPTRADAAPLLIVLKGELAKRGDQAARREVDSAAGASGGAC